MYRLLGLNNQRHHFAWRPRREYVRQNHELRRQGFTNHEKPEASCERADLQAFRIGSRIKNPCASEITCQIERCFQLGSNVGKWHAKYKVTLEVRQFKSFQAKSHFFFVAVAVAAKLQSQTTKNIPGSGVRRHKRFGRRYSQCYEEG